MQQPPLHPCYGMCCYIYIRSWHKVFLHIGLLWRLVTILISKKKSQNIWWFWLKPSCPRCSRLHPRACSNPPSSYCRSSPVRTGTLSCTTGSRRTEASRWVLTSSFGFFFYFSTLSSFCPSGAASKREVAGNCQSQIWGWTSHSSLFLCFPNCLQNLQNSVKGCHSIFSLQYFFVLFTKSVASVLM